jgi:hypothetical protein
MIWAFVFLVVAGGVAYWLRQLDMPRQETPPPDPEREMQAAVELHRIRRNLDVAWAKSEQRRAGAVLRRDIKEALEDEQ